jgi:hypothetical protein
MKDDRIGQDIQKRNDAKYSKTANSTKIIHFKRAQGEKSSKKWRRSKMKFCFGFKQTREGSNKPKNRLRLNPNAPQRPCGNIDDSPIENLPIPNLPNHIRTFISYKQTQKKLSNQKKKKKKNFGEPWRANNCVHQLII